MSKHLGVTVTLRPGKEKPARNRHPWIFSGAIERVDGQPQDGDVVTVASADGQFLGRAYINQRSQITLRILTWEEGEAIDTAFWRARLARASAGRRLLDLGAETTAYRLVNAEADLAPGLVVDRYGDYLVVQFLTVGIERWRDTILDVLAELCAPAGIYERDDVPVRAKEGLRERVGCLRGQEPPAEIEALERGRRFLVDIRCGQKTGFYLDQRDNRLRVSRYAAGREMLNCFAYSGGFAVYAAGAGASRLVNVDVSADALTLGARNLALNGLDGTPAEHCVADVFQELRRLRDAGRQFDLIVLDPPKFAASEAQVMAAARGYKDINLLALQLLRRDGVLATFSCSGGVSLDLFQKIVFGASVDAHRSVQIIETLTQAGDHPTLLSFPEAAYLKGFILRAL
jgi:23S rRNA (cytosine1962-C5)-methyltransferase